MPVVDNAAYRLARLTASRSGRPSPRKVAKLPIKASPAPVLSTLFTRVNQCSGGCHTTIEMSQGSNRSEVAPIHLASARALEYSLGDGHRLAERTVGLDRL